MYTLPQEIEVWYVIPAIRKSLATCLVQKHNLTYEKVGGLMGITKAAVSQYIKNKRATKIKLNDKIKKEICFSCKQIAAKKSIVVKEITRILKLIKDKKYSIEVCNKRARDAVENCKEITINYQS